MILKFWTSKQFPSALCFATLLMAGGIPNAAAQQSYTWDQIKAKFEADNPTLKADQSSVDEMKAEEITAYLPVSYTHLDVYKRQGLHRPPVNPIRTEHAAARFCRSRSPPDRRP